MAQRFNCPACGAPLQPDGPQAMISCEYCGESVVVPTELREYPKSQPGIYSVPVTIEGTAGGSGSWVRQMMMLIRAGQLDQAAQVFGQATGTTPDIARMTVERIAQRVSASSRINPDELNSLLTFGGGGGAGYPPPSGIPGAGGMPQTPSARRGGCSWLACGVVGLIILVGVLVPIIISVRSMDVITNQLPAILGAEGSNAQKTALAPAEMLKTQMAPIMDIATEQVGTLEAAGNLIEGTPTPNPDQPVLTIGGEGTGQGKLKDARDIAIDGQGRIYTVEYMGGRVQVFDSQGKFLALWRIDAKAPVRGLAVDKKGTVFIVQSGVIQAYEGLTGKTLRKLPGSSYDGVFLTPDGKLAAVQTGIQDNIVLMDTNGKVLSTIKGAISTQSGESELDMKVTVDDKGTLYALGTFNSAVFKFGANGKFLNRFGAKGDQPGQFRAVEAIAVDDQGQVYVSDISGVQVFDGDGRYLRTIKLPSGVPFGLVFDNEHLFVTNRTDIYKIAIK
jgi:DNA-binding beta-propeller fold protein YncE